MKTTYNFQNLPQITSAKIAIIQSKWYKDLTDIMVEKVKSEGSDNV